MAIESQLSLLEAILGEWQAVLGADYPGYRNHVYRMVHCCLNLRNCSEEEKQKILIAAAFHDLGLWVDDTLDYLPPSAALAEQYLHRQGLEAWTDEIVAMITEHHKLRECDSKQPALVELFRRGDLVDFSMGLFRFGISRAYIKQLKTTFPNAGFHQGLAKRALKWFIKHPFNPAPMMKW